jgi:hypothetical protein
MRCFGASPPATADLKLANDSQPDDLPECEPRGARTTGFHANQQPVGLG